MRQVLALFLCAVIFIPLTGSIYDQPVYDRSNYVLLDESSPLA